MKEEEEDNCKKSPNKKLPKLKLWQKLLHNNLK
jgi:hypothetical protein